MNPKRPAARIPVPYSCPILMAAPLVGVLEAVAVPAVAEPEAAPVAVPITDETAELELEEAALTVVALRVPQE
jgi:hypothetical protein